MSTVHPEAGSPATVDPSTSSTDEEQFLAQVHACLEESVREADAAAQPLTASLASSELLRASDLGALVRRLLDTRGKMLRPRLVRWGHLAVAGPEPTLAVSDDVIRVAAAFELLHVFGLLQDDVMDASPTRRGLPSAHRLVTAAVPAGTAGPDAARVGANIAVLAGDLAFFLAGRLVRDVPRSVADAWDATVLELVHGQRLDLVFSTEARFDAVSTLRVAEAKSGAYSVQRPLEIGALLHGRSRAPRWLSDYGAAVGRAFALADDLIGIWGDPGVSGKPVGEDLLEGKPSLVIGLAEEMLGGQLSRRLAPGRPALGEDEAHEMVRRMDDAGVRERALTMLSAMCDDALLALAQAGPELPDVVREHLARLTQEVATRES